MLTGAETRRRMMLTCSRVFSADSIAQGSDPSAPPCAAAITSSASITPAIGASTIGSSVLKRSISRRSGHMVLVSRGSGGNDGIAPAGKQLLGLQRDALDDFGRRGNIMDQADGLAG